MTENAKELQRSLDSLARLVNRIDAQAKALVGEDARVLFEPRGRLHVIVGDGNGTLEERLGRIRASATIVCRMEASAW